MFYFTFWCWKDFGGLEAEIFDVDLVLEGFWRACVFFPFHCSFLTFWTDFVRLEAEIFDVVLVLDGYCRGFG